MTTIALYAYVEDRPSKAATRKIVAYVNQTSETKVAFVEGFPSIVRGSGNIRAMVPELIKMAKNKIPSLIVTDPSCAPSLIRDWAGLPGPGALVLPSHLIFRVAVREIESWIMADRDAFAAFMGISKAN